MATTASRTAEDRKERLTQQRRTLPDGPGVYLFRDSKGRVIYVGKAKSIRSRVASHFSSSRREMVSEIDHIEFVLVSSEAEALLAEQNFIKQYKPRFNVRLRDDKSYPFIAISMDEEFPRVYFTRERHRRDRLYFGPYSNAKRVRGTLDLLGKIFLFRSCTGVEPGRRSGSPCLDYFIKRCGAPCVGYVSPEEYRASIDEVIAFLQGRYREIERDLEQRMRTAAAEQEFEQAALERNRLRAVRSLLERQRVANESVGTLDAVAVAVSGTDANAQVFQVRDGVLSDRQSFYLSNDAAREVGDVAQEFLLQYYGGAISIPPQIIVQGQVDDLEALGELLTERRGGRVEVRAAERGDKRRILDLAERNARLAMDTERLKVERRHQQRVEALDALQTELGLDVLPIRIECFDISNLMGTNTTAVARPRASPTTSPRWRRSCPGATRSGSVSRTSHRTTRSATSPSRRSRASSSSTAAPASWPPACARWSPGASAASRSSRSRSGWRRSTARVSASRCGWRTTRRRSSSCSASATRPTASRSPITARGATRR
jgi:excinuclease ABC subunit C